MNKTTKWIIGIVIIVAISWIGYTGFDKTASASGTSASLKSFQYVVRYDLGVWELSKLGKFGWELVTVVSDEVEVKTSLGTKTENQKTFYFKRAY